MIESFDQILIVNYRWTICHSKPVKNQNLLKPNLVLYSCTTPLHGVVRATFQKKEIHSVHF